MTSTILTNELRTIRAIVTSVMNQIVDESFYLNEVDGHTRGRGEAIIYDSSKAILEELERATNESRGYWRMTEEKRKKLERMSQSIAILRQSVKNEFSVLADEVLIEQFDWLQVELKAAWDLLAEFYQSVPLEADVEPAKE